MVAQNGRAIAMKNILIAIEPSKILPSVYETAFLAAQRFNSCLEGFRSCPWEWCS